MHDASASEADRKTSAAAQARAALAGWVLAEKRAGDTVRFVASRWGRSRELQNLAVVKRSLRQVEGSTCGKA
jgi:hypothetical protein